jgi:hypothetical protein
MEQASKPTTLYEHIDARSKKAAEEWMLKICPRLEEGAKEWLGENPHLDEEVYNTIVHPVLLWRFFHHLALLLTEGAEGWKRVYRANTESKLGLVWGWGVNDDRTEQG